MAIMVPTAGETKILERIFNRSTINNGLKVCLFTNDYTPNKNTVKADLDEVKKVGTTSELDDKYVQQLLPATTPLNGIATFTQLTFDLGGAANGYSVFGYFVMDATTGELLWYERFPAEFSIASSAKGGGQIKVTLKMELE